MRREGERAEKLGGGVSLAINGKPPSCGEYHGVVSGILDLK